MARRKRKTVSQDKFLDLLWAMSQLAITGLIRAEYAKEYIKAAGYGGLLIDGGASHHSRTLAPAKAGKVRKRQKRSEYVR